MTIVLRKNGQSESDAVLDAAGAGLHALGFEVRFQSIVRSFDGPSVFHGVLNTWGKIPTSDDWWMLDRGWVGSVRHGTGGTFRLSRNAVQPAFDPKADVNGSRLGGIHVKPWLYKKGGIILVCPPTVNIVKYYGLRDWVGKTVPSLPKSHTVVVRKKDDKIPLQEHLKEARAVVTFNSSVAVTAILGGVPAFAEEGIVRSWSGIGPGGCLTDPMKLPHSREALACFLTHCQFTVGELRSGLAWKTSFRVQGTAWKGAYA